MSVDIDGAEITFGRIPTYTLSKDYLYPMASAFTEPIELTGKVLWRNRFPALNQGVEGTCVGHGVKCFLLTEPEVQSTPDTDPTAVWIYDRATEIDEFPGNEGDRTYGTSTRAGMAVLKELGLIAEYRHGQNLDDVLRWLYEKGPVVIGVNWYEGMAYSRYWTDDYLVKTGNIIGGHCVCLIGVDFDERNVTLMNSWGPSWGPMRNGTAKLRFEDLDQLLFRERGDAIAALEIPLGPIDPPEPPPPPPPPPEPPVPPMFPYQETYAWTYDNSRDMWVWRFRVQRGTGDWGSGPNTGGYPQFPYQETTPVEYDAASNSWVWEFSIQRGTGGWVD